jgi:hypothetical protein
LIDIRKNSFRSFPVPTIQTNKKIQYLNIESAFDIETTSVKFNEEDKSAFMYIWMFGMGLGEPIYYGRTWEEFTELCRTLQKKFGLSEKRRLVVYIHSLSYEFQFMRKHFRWKNIFAVDKQKPIRALCSYGIEFRDSYILSGYSLENTAKNLTTHKVKKLTGDLDYSLIRTPKTELTPEEMAYCNNDIEIILAYIREQIDQYGDIDKIPMTNTGRVRDYVRRNCYYTSRNHRKTNAGKYRRYKDIMKDLTLDPKSYLKLKQAFMGGFTHANPMYSGKVLENVTSIDFTSSYPAVMLSEKYPMSRGQLVYPKSTQEFEELCRTKCVMFDIILENVEPIIFQENYISESKCYAKSNVLENNGRVFSADMLAMTITDVDYSIIKRCYKWTKMRIKNVVKYEPNYLPKSIIESILNLYEKKTVLKGVDGSEVEYLLSKGMLNSVYGMSVTDIVQDNHIYSDEWEKETADVGEQIDKYNKSAKRFLYYPWGVWVTAYARKNLWTGILAMGDDYVYSDTDSIKLLNYESHKRYVDGYNKIITAKLHRMCEELNIDKSRLAPKNKKGQEKLIGIWDYEGTYTRFKTLGAKRYMVQNSDGSFELTVAGLSKQNGMNYLIEKCSGNPDKIFKQFNDNMFIPAERTGKMTHTYIDERKEFTIQDYKGEECRIVTESGVHLEPVEFNLSIAKQYGTFLYNLMNGYIYEGVNYV